MDLAPGITEALGQTRLDRRMPILKALIEDKGTLAEIIAKLVEFSDQVSRLGRTDDADMGKPFDMCLARLYVVEEELAV